MLHIQVGMFSGNAGLCATEFSKQGKAEEKRILEFSAYDDAISLKTIGREGTTKN